jgi:hypothetical protein
MGDVNKSQPSAFVLFVRSTSASIASHPAFLTLRNAPRLGQDQIALFLRLPGRQAKIRKFRN